MFCPNCAFQQTANDPVCVDCGAPRPAGGWLAAAPANPPNNPVPAPAPAAPAPAAGSRVWTALKWLAALALVALAAWWILNHFAPTATPPPPPPPHQQPAPVPPQPTPPSPPPPTSWAPPAPPPAGWTLVTTVKRLSAGHRAISIARGVSGEFWCTPETTSCEEMVIAPAEAGGGIWCQVVPNTCIIKN